MLEAAGLSSSRSTLSWSFVQRYVDAGERQCDAFCWGPRPGRCQQSHASATALARSVSGNWITCFVENTDHRRMFWKNYRSLESTKESSSERMLAHCPVYEKNRALEETRCSLKKQNNPAENPATQCKVTVYARAYWAVDYAVGRCLAEWSWLRLSPRNGSGWRIHCHGRWFSHLIKNIKKKRRWIGGSKMYFGRWNGPENQASHSRSVVYVHCRRFVLIDSGIW